MKYFRCIDRGVPVPLKIPTKSCLRGFIVDYWGSWIVIGVMFALITVMTYANWKVFKQGYVPIELTADQIKSKTQVCVSKGKKAVFAWGDDFKVYFVKCK